MSRVFGLSRVAIEAGMMRLGAVACIVSRSRLALKRAAPQCLDDEAARIDRIEQRVRERRGSASSSLASASAASADHDRPREAKANAPYSPRTRGRSARCAPASAA